MANELTDARGVEISPGDTVIYGFGVGRSVAMAEGVVLAADHEGQHPWPPEDGWPVSLTPKGRVRIRVVRRSYSSGEKPVVDIAPDRLVVLKPLEYRIPGFYGDPETGAVLPPSPLPTQDQANAAKLREEIKRSTDRLRELSIGSELTEWEIEHATRYGKGSSPLGYWVVRHTEDLTRYRAELMKIEERDPDG